jgi:hypothetical protein
VIDTWEKFCFFRAMKQWSLGLLCLAVCAVGCGPDVEAIPQVTDQMARDMGVEKPQLQRGRDLYMAHCNQCHARVQPAKIDPEYWREILPHMSKNAKLNSSQLRDLQTYLIAAHGTVYQLDPQH